MKRRLIEFLILIFFICSKSYALPPECRQLFDAIKKESIKTDLANIEFVEFLDPGFEVKWIYNWDEEEWFLDRDKNGYLKVGRITDESVAEKLKHGDVIFRMNDKDTKLFKNNDDLSDFYEKNENFKVDVEGKRYDENGKPYKASFQLNLPRKRISIQDEPVDLNLKAINRIDIKNSTFEVYFERVDKNKYYLDTENLPLAQLALDILVFPDPEVENLPGDEDNWEWSYEGCRDISLEQFRELNLVLPGADIHLNNLTKLNANMISEIFNFIPYSTKKGIDDDSDYLMIKRVTYGTYNIINKFNLGTFPFDKQRLVIPFQSKLGLSYHNFYLDPDTVLSLDFFKKNSSIEGWIITGYEINESLIDDRYGPTAGQSLEIIVERKHGYYLYKVLIPIILILMICWSVVWIDPRELESRLTITIVCLLSLIAYNFVIDSELPKLEYLTVLDLIILISYFYATIPNFLTIISFNLSKTNIERCKRYEMYAKKFGPTSYLLSVLLIIFFRVFANPDNASEMVSWMVGK